MLASREFPETDVGSCKIMRKSILPTSMASIYGQKLKVWMIIVAGVTTSKLSFSIFNIFYAFLCSAGKTLLSLLKVK